ncbi:hypothetical protein IscW_ISCW007710 [Ixodes scapularis]|uniref:Uncharacterized protein n=1 Tax=Ixodes scapularis TaxID=6945 RepID=B7PVK4_IXOSC|nr:hypothetical protein IscW_ISCW007710 [Ixodes scapularis]|eukprot:XP_002408134.1 hypothetical protein IscW_ISCW007710 [Ixodes scapularis]
MSHFGYVPVFYVKQLDAPSQDFKNRLLTTLQSAIRQQPEWGYWPWVRKFTHEESVQEISSLSNVSTGLGQGRAWLFASLNAALLEGYMRSFAQNQKLLKKGYSTDSFLRDVEGVSSLTLSSADGSSGDSHDDGEDSGILSAHVSSTTLASLASPAEEVHIPETCGCADCATFLNDERIRRIISLEADYTDLEVIRAPRSRRKKGSEPSASDGSSAEGIRDVPEEQVDSGALLEAVGGVGGSENSDGPALEEDEASIYDGRGETATACAVQEEQLGKESSSGEVDRPELVEDVREEDLASMPRRKSGGLDLKVENNSLLFLVLEIFEADDEKLYKMFLSWKRYDGAGRLQPVFLLLSTRNLYLLSPGGEGGPRFVKDSVVPLHNVGLINVEEVVVKDYRLVHWEIDTHPEAGELSPAGATRSGPLMWRFLENRSKKEKKKQWESSYFLLRAGVLYRFRCPEDTIASSSYLISSSGCGASQPATEAGRPHTLQLNLGPKGACLQLAASNQADLELWAKAFRRAAQHPGRPAEQGGLVACCLVLVGDLVLTLVEGGRVLGRGGVVDIGLVRSEDVFCVLVSLDITHVKSNNLKSHCLERAAELSARISELQALCLDV